MAGWLLRRLGQVVPTLLILSFMIFGLQQLMPGDPAIILAGEERGDPVVLAQIRAELRLDRPIWEQYLHWMGNVVQGDFGFSWRIRMPVSELILQKLPVTAQLASMAFIIGIVIGVPLGILSATRRDTPLDWAANGIALFGISTPNFWLGIMMILLFSVQLGWLPPSGYVPLWEDPVQSLATTIMPAFVLGTGVASVLMRHTRAAMLTAQQIDGKPMLAAYRKIDRETFRDEAERTYRKLQKRAGLKAGFGSYSAGWLQLLEQYLAQRTTEQLIRSITATTQKNIVKMVQEAIMEGIGQD